MAKGFLGSDLRPLAGAQGQVWVAAEEDKAAFLAVDREVWGFATVGKQIWSAALEMEADLDLRHGCGGRCHRIGECSDCT